MLLPLSTLLQQGGFSSPLLFPPLRFFCFCGACGGYTAARKNYVNPLRPCTGVDYVNAVELPPFSDILQCFQSLRKTYVFRIVPFNFCGFMCTRSPRFLTLSQVVKDTETNHETPLFSACFAAVKLSDNSATGVFFCGIMSAYCAAISAAVLSVPLRISITCVLVSVYPKTLFE